MWPLQGGGRGAGKAPLLDSAVCQTVFAFAYVHKLAAGMPLGHLAACGLSVLLLVAALCARHQRQDQPPSLHAIWSAQVMA
jgi:hypothetical protein